jgi:hypothetical protein
VPLLFRLFVAGAMLATASAASSAAEPAPKRAVDVRADATDALTTRFADALRAALPAGERVRVQTPEEDDDLALVIANVAPDGKKFGWSLDLLKVNPGFTPSRFGAFAGKCRQDALADCAKGVIADADRAVRKAAKD